ncbi:MAG: fused MFS/spermidine synthase [Opitutae bacterium]|nr:fused MFS/spermidine synthase [Opitutae bacterium]
MHRHHISSALTASASFNLHLLVSLIAFYALVVVLGILSMGFQLLASRLLNPHFGSSIIVWAWLISTFLAAFSIGSMLGGWISNVAPARRFRLQATTAALAVGALAFTAVLGRLLLNRIELAFGDSSTGLLIACIGLFFLPVTMLSTFGPQCVHYLAQRGTAPGAASGVVYGVSTLGNIAGVMLTAFALIPSFRVSTLLYGWLAVAILSLTGLIALLRAAAPASPTKP